jgi:hypothetical protein
MPHPQTCRCTETMDPVTDPKTKNQGPIATSDYIYKPIAAALGSATSMPPIAAPGPSSALWW